MRRVGVLELYLSYAPIARAVTKLLSTMYRDLIIGLGALYLALFAISASVNERLRRQSMPDPLGAGQRRLRARPAGRR